MISIIVPVYNAELYLERCINSLLAQTYSDYEIILSDDGSTDASPQICDKYEKEHENIHAIHNVNHGAGAARNRGVEIARGEYITFVDADDYVSKDYLSYLVKLQIGSKADIAIGRYLNTSEPGLTFERVNYPLEYVALSGQEACRLFLMNQGNRVLRQNLEIMCSKLFRTELCRKYPMPTGRKYEDRATIYKYYYDSPRICVGNQIIYGYYNNPNSVMHSNYGKKNDDNILAKFECIRFFEMAGDKELAQLACKDAYKLLILDSAAFHGRCDDELRQLMKQKSVPDTISLRLKIYFRFPKFVRRVYIVKRYYKRIIQLAASGEGRHSMIYRMKNNRFRDAVK